MDTNMYFEESLKSDDRAKFEESIDPVLVSAGSSIIENGDSENVQAPVLKVNQTSDSYVV